MILEEAQALEQWWIEKSRRNFFAYRKFTNGPNFKINWFVQEVTALLQWFYVAYKAGEKPILILNTPPQHGKSWSVIDLISWMIGLDQNLKIIYASYSEDLGVKANLALQRKMCSEKYKKIFDKININEKHSISNYQRNKYIVEFWNSKENGFFRNTTVQGAITGQSMDIGIIDDPTKGAKEAKSLTVSERIWDWYNEDFSTRFSENAGVILPMTRWSTNDLTGRLLKIKKEKIKLCAYKAIATKDEKYRKTGEVLFPEHKSKEFILDKKKTFSESRFEALYQQNPTIEGGGVFKDSWWKWWRTLPPLKFTFIVADTAQKDKKTNDWTVFQCWGYGVDDCIYLLDQYRGKPLSPTLRRDAWIFYQKFNKKRHYKEKTVPLRGMWIEDKSSGIGLIQELKEKKAKVHGIPRNVDKTSRADDCTPEIEAGKVFLNVDIPHIDITTKEGREFPNSEFDDSIECVMNAIEIAYIHKTLSNSLKAAMEADE